MLPGQGCEMDTCTLAVKRASAETEHPSRCDDDHTSLEKKVL